MKSAAVIFVSLLLLIQTRPAPTQVRVMPFFSDVSGSGLLLEYTNTTTADIVLGTGLLCVERIDGVASRGGGGSFGGRHIRPGESWWEATRLVNAGTTDFQNPLPRLVSLFHQISTQLATGRHTIAFNCGGGWAPDVTFFWVDAPTKTMPTSAAASSKPVVMPFLSDRAASGFLIEARNMTSAEMHVTSAGACDYRMDGQVDSEGRGGTGGAVSVAPNATWLELVRPTTVPREPGARSPANPLRGTVAAYHEVRPPLTLGPHTIAFRCGQATDWSDDFSFYWAVTPGVRPRTAGV